MVVWFVNQYAGHPTLGSPGRHYFLSKHLKSYDVESIIICSSYNHLRSSSNNGLVLVKKVILNNITYFFLKTLKYESPRSIIRIFNWFLFAINIFLVPFFAKRPDVIVYSSPSLLGFFPCYIIGKCLGSKVVFEVRDIWPDSIVQLGGFNRRNPFIKLMYFYEKFCYEYSDLIFSNLQFFDEYLDGINLNLKSKFYWLPNGVDVNSFNKLSSCGKMLPPKLISDSIHLDKIVIGYIGTIGNANAIEKFIHPLSSYKNIDNFIFKIYGEGSSKIELINYCVSNKLNNVLFYDSVPFSEVYDVISNFDYCILATNDCGIYNYGVASLKIPEYMFAKKPIIHFSTRSVVSQANCGFVVHPSSIASYHNVLDDILCLNKSKLDILSQNAFDFANKVYDYKVITKKFFEILFV